jgi:hypothetical protein
LGCKVPNRYGDSNHGKDKVREQLKELEIAEIISFMPDIGAQPSDHEHDTNHNGWKGFEHGRLNGSLVVRSHRCNTPE